MPEDQVIIKISAEAKQALETINNVVDRLKELGKVDVSKSISKTTKSIQSIGESSQGIKDVATGFNRVIIETKTFDKMAKQANDTVGDLSANFLKTNKGIIGYRRNMGLAKSTTEELRNEVFDIFVPMRGISQEMETIQSPAQNLIDNFSDLDAKLKIAGISQNKFLADMKENNLTFNQQGEIIDALTGRFIDNGTAVRKASTNLKRFNFSFLSLLFAGMALDRVFGSLIRKQLELFGVTDMLSAMWTVVLLPIMEILTPIIYSLLEAFLNMSDGGKLAVGAFVLIGAALGTLFIILGQVYLGMKGLIGAFNVFKGVFAGLKFGSIFSGITSGIVTVLSYLAPVAAIVIGIIDIFKYWGTSLKGVVGGIIIALGGLLGIIAVILGAPALLVAAIVTALVITTKLIVKYWDQIKAFYIRTWEFLKNAFISIWNSLIAFYQGIWNQFTNFATNGMNTLKNILDVGWAYIQQSIANRWNNIKEFFTSTWESITEIFDQSVDFITTLPSRILEAFTGLGNRIKEAITDILPEWMIDLFRRGIRLIRSGGDVFGDILGSFQTGGMVPETGAYILHRGEEVVPRNEVGSSNTFSPSIVVNVSGGASSVDANNVARIISEQLNREWAYRFERMVAR